MVFAKRFAGALLAGTLMVSACSTSGSTASFNTSEFAQDAQAVAYAAEIIVNLDVVKSHIGTNDQKNIADILAQIKTITSEAAANSNGVITVDTGKTWAKSLASELQQLLTIASPIVKQYDATAAGYIDTVAAIIPFIEALAGITPVSVTPAYITDPVAASPVKIDKSGTFVSDSSPAVRAKIYAGFTPTVGLDANQIRGSIYHGTK